MVQYAGLACQQECAQAALRLSKALGVDDRFWINIQTDYDLEIQRDLHAEELAKVTSLVAS